jgi:hypothetical protein
MGKFTKNPKNCWFCSKTKQKGNFHHTVYKYCTFIKLELGNMSVPLTPPGSGNADDLVEDRNMSILLNSDVLQGKTNICMLYVVMPAQSSTNDKLVQMSKFEDRPSPV